MKKWPTNRKELLDMLLEVARDDEDLAALAKVEAYEKATFGAADSLARMLQDCGFRGEDANFLFNQCFGNPFDYRTLEDRKTDLLQ